MEEQKNEGAANHRSDDCAVPSFLYRKMELLLFASQTNHVPGCLVQIAGHGSAVYLCLI